MARTVDEPIRNEYGSDTFAEWRVDSTELVDREKHSVFLCCHDIELVRLWTYARVCVMGSGMYVSCVILLWLTNTESWQQKKRM